MARHATRTVRPEVETLEARTVLSVTYPAIANAIAFSTENVERVIGQDYTNLLHRSGSPAEINGWVGRVEAGMTLNQVDALFTGSAEYVNDHYGAGPDYVAGLYQDLLGRTPNTAEVNGWLGQLDNHVSPQAVASVIANSTEHLADQVTADYVQYLGRTPSGAEVSGWVNALRAGENDLNVVSDMVASSENFNRYGDSPRNWLMGTYESVLDRPADAKELQGWLNVLSVNNAASAPAIPAPAATNTCSTDSNDNTANSAPVDNSSDNTANCAPVDNSSDNTAPVAVDTSSSDQGPLTVDMSDYNTYWQVATSSTPPDPYTLDYNTYWAEVDAQQAYQDSQD